MIYSLIIKQTSSVAAVVALIFAFVELAALKLGPCCASPEWSVKASPIALECT